MSGPRRTGRGLLIPALRRGGRALREGARLYFDAASGLPRATTPTGPLRGYRLGLLDKMGAESAKGGILVHDGKRWVPLGVGSNTHVLTADSAEASGVKWAAGGGGGGSVADNVVRGGAASGWSILSGGFAGGQDNRPLQNSRILSSSPNYRPRLWYFGYNALDMLWWSPTDDWGGGGWLPSGLSTLRLRWSWGPYAGTGNGNVRWFVRAFQYAADAEVGTSPAWDYTASSTISDSGKVAHANTEATLDLDLTQGGGYDSDRLTFISFGRDGTHVADTSTRSSWLFAGQLEVS